MQKASELRKSLADCGFSEDEITQMVSDRIQKGMVEDDSTNVDPSEVAALAAEVRKSLATTADGKSETMQKGASELPEAKVTKETKDDGVYIDVDASFGSLTKSVNAQNELIGNLIKSNVGGDSNLAKGLLAVGRLTELSLNSLRGVNDQIAELNKSLTGLREALGQPVPPRAVTGSLTAVPHPSETQPAQAAPAEVPFSKSSAEVIASIKDQMRKAHEAGDQSSSLKHLATAVSELESGIDAGSVVRKYNINVG